MARTIPTTPVVEKLSYNVLYFTWKKNLMLNSALIEFMILMIPSGSLYYFSTKTEVILSTSGAHHVFCGIIESILLT